MNVLTRVFLHMCPRDADLLRGPILKNNIDCPYTQTSHWVPEAVLR